MASAEGRLTLPLFAVVLGDIKVRPEGILDEMQHKSGQSAAPLWFPQESRTPVLRI